MTASDFSTVASEGLTHDRTRSHAGSVQRHLHETGHPHMEPPINPARFTEPRTGPRCGRQRVRRIGRIERHADIQQEPGSIAGLELDAVSPDLVGGPVNRQLDGRQGTARKTRGPAVGCTIMGTSYERGAEGAMSRAPRVRASPQPRPRSPNRAPRSVMPRGSHSTTATTITPRIRSR